MYVCYTLFIALCVNDFWCKLPEDGDNTETCSSSVIERMRRMKNCASFRFTGLLIHRCVSFVSLLYK